MCASRNLYETELSLLVDPDYMENHGPDYQPKMYIDQSMRMIVISWLVEVACEYDLHQETLFLAAALLDRFMSVAKVGSALLCAVRHALAITTHVHCVCCAKSKMLLSGKKLLFICVVAKSGCCAKTIPTSYWNKLTSS